MNPILPLMQREWLQHRFAWALLALLPLGLALLAASFADIGVDVDGETMAQVADARMAPVFALASMAASTGLLFLILWVTSLIIISGLARRDHGDRSVEFWISLPVGHGTSLAVPLFVHLLLVPAAALVVGLLGGWLLSLVLVGRFVGLGEWFALPWGTVLVAALAVLARLMAGLVLATLWISPLIMLLILANAWFRRWGLVLLVVGMGIGGLVMDRIFGQPIVTDLVRDLFVNAGRALAGASGESMAIGRDEDPATVLGLVPGWAWHDFVAALRRLASPLLIGGLLFAGGCFALLVDWRRRGASAAA
jgi:ABC-2 type transport system permease protein